MSTSDDFWTIVCRYAAYFYLLLVVLTMLLIGNLLAFLLAQQDPGAYAITVVNFGILGVTALGVIGVLWYCQN